MANFSQKKISFAKILFVAFALLSFFQATSVLALEISYPKIGTLGITDASRPEEVVRYFYALSVSLVGIIVLIALLWGGILWLTSGGNPSKIGEARQKIFASLTGAILILSSYLILTLINPNLTILNIEKPPPAVLITGADIYGYVLCKTGSGGDREATLEAIDSGNCTQLSRTGWNINIPQEYIDAGFSLSSFPGGPGNYYAILLPRNPNDPNQPSKSFEKCNVLLDDGTDHGSLTTEEARYIMSGQYSETADPEIKITFCEDVNCTIENPLAPTIGFEQWEPFFKVRAMKINEGAQVEKIILSDEIGLNGACFITNENEPSFVFAFAHSSKLDETDVDAGPYSEVSSRIVLPKVTDGTVSAACSQTFGASRASSCSVDTNNWMIPGTLQSGDCISTNTLAPSTCSSVNGNCFVSSDTFNKARNFIDTFNGQSSGCTLRISSTIRPRDIGESECHRVGNGKDGTCIDFNILPSYTEECRDAFYEAAENSGAVYSLYDEYVSPCDQAAIGGGNVHVNF